VKQTAESLKGGISLPTNIEFVIIFLSLDQSDIDLIPDARCDGPRRPVK
jgi:hypothetical protein